MDRVSSALQVSDQALAWVLSRATLGGTGAAVAALETAGAALQTRFPGVAVYTRQMQITSIMISGGLLLREAVRVCEVAHWALAPGGLWVAALGAAYFVPPLFQKYFHKQETAQEVLPWDALVKVEWIQPTTQYVVQWIHLARIVTGIALFYFGDISQTTLAITALGLSYSILENAKLKWIQVSRTFPTEEVDFSGLREAVRLETAYSWLIIKDKGNECFNCEEDTGRDVNRFCPSHLYHTACTAKWVEEMSKSWLRNISGMTKYVEVDKTGAARTTHYSLAVPAENFGVCPHCRTDPPHATLEVTNKGIPVYLSLQGMPDRLSLWGSRFAEMANTAYNGIQAVLASTQNTRFEMASQIARIQRFSIIADVVAFGRDYYILWKDLRKKKYSVSVILISTAVSAAVAAYALLTLNRRLIPSISLSGSDRLKIRWTKPIGYQWLQLIRIMVNLASAATGPKSTFKFKITNALFQSLTLFNISRPQWLHVERTYTPNEIPLFAQDCTANFTFILPSALPQFDSAMDDIRNYTAAVFKESDWNPYWQIKTVNGVEIRRSLHANVLIKNKFIGTIWTQLWDVTAKAAITLSRWEVPEATLHINLP